LEFKAERYIYVSKIRGAKQKLEFAVFLQALDCPRYVDPPQVDRSSIRLAQP
jgi:hypothetical protein